MTERVIFSVVQLAEYPATRALGQDGRNRLDDLIEGRFGVELLVDFAGVEVMNLSFADEFLGKFLTSHDFGAEGTTVKLTGLTEDNRYTVGVCVERRETQVVVDDDEDDTVALLGDAMLAETLERALRLGSFKANDLAAVALTSQNANNRLKRLARCGALRKTQATGSSRGGKEFVYEAVSADVPDSERLTSA